MAMTIEAISLMCLGSLISLVSSTILFLTGDKKSKRIALLLGTLVVLSNTIALVLILVDNGPQTPLLLVMINTGMGYPCFIAQLFLMIMNNITQRKN